MKPVLKFIDSLSCSIVFVFGVLLVLTLGYIDHATGYEISFSIFYLLPVLLVSWRIGAQPGAAIALLSAAIWMWADIFSGHTYSHLAIPVWNAMMRLGFFLIVGFSFSEIKRLLVKEQDSARIDPLTGIANSRSFKEMANAEISRSLRYGHQFTMAYIDIDNFKQVNDTLGHSHGDKVLQSTARTIRDNTRTIDIVSRLGGDEFAILLPETDSENAHNALTNIRGKLLEMVDSNKWPVSFSIGAVTCHESCKLDDLIKEADDLMYEVKRSGKNNIKFHIHQPATL